MFSKSIRSELVLRTLECMIKKRVIRVEVSRASSNKSADPKDYECTIEALKPIYTQGYPSMRTVGPYERQPYLYHQPKPTVQRFRNKSELSDNTTACPHNAEEFPYYTAGFSQNAAGIPQSGKCDCIGPCCFGVCGGVQDSKTPPCSGTQSHIPPTVSSVQGACRPPQPCPCCCQYPCCCRRCGNCSPNGNWCIPQTDCCGRRIVPPPECRPGQVPPNPCCPQYPKKGVYKIYRSIFFFICIPVIIVQFINAMSHEPCPKIPCREYEYMRIRTKRFPWGEGVESFFHNEEVNHLPGDCGPPELVCEP